MLVTKKLEFPTKFSQLTKNSAEASFALQLKGKFALRIFIAILNIIVYIFILVIFIIILIDPTKQQEGFVIYEFSIVFVVVYSLICALIFLFFSCLTIIRLYRFKNVRKTKKLLANAFLVSKN